MSWFGVFFIGYIVGSRMALQVSECWRQCIVPVWFGFFRPDVPEEQQPTGYGWWQQLLVQLWTLTLYTHEMIRNMGHELPCEICPQIFRNIFFCLVTSETKSGKKLIGCIDQKSFYRSVCIMLDLLRAIRVCLKELKLKTFGCSLQSRTHGKNMVVFVLMTLLGHCDLKKRNK